MVPAGVVVQRLYDLFGFIVNKLKIGKNINVKVMKFKFSLLTVVKLSAFQIPGLFL